MMIPSDYVVQCLNFSDGFMNDESLAPVQTSRRLVLLDALRGLAIFGILMVNMPLMFQPISTLMIGADGAASPSQCFAESIIKMLFEGKFYVLFSFLFGYGFWMFMNKEARGGAGINTLYLRRVFVLFLFGVVHVLLLWAGDILVFYAMFGFVLLVFRSVKDRTAVIWSGVFIAVPIILSMLGVGIIALISFVPDASLEIRKQLADNLSELRGFVERASDTYAHGSFPDIVAVRVEEYIGLLLGVVFFYPVVLGLFLLGMVAARRELLADPAAHTALLRRILRLGVLVGLPCAVIYAIAYRYTSMSMPDGWSLLSTTLHTVGGIALGWSYAAFLVLRAVAGKADAVIRLLAPVGRMALTNYIMHSFITAVLFHSYGFALFGRVEIWQGMLLCVVIFAAQIVLSSLWLRHFHFGPIEWIWRAATYGTFPSFRIARE